MRDTPCVMAETRTAVVVLARGSSKRGNVERAAVRHAFPPLLYCCCNPLCIYGGISSRLMLFLILNNFIIPSIRKRFPPEMVNISVAFVLSVAAAKMWLYEGKPP